MINATHTIVSINGKQKNLGYYKSQKDALKALRLAELENSYKEKKIKKNNVKNNVKNTSINIEPDTKPKNTRINILSHIKHFILVFITLGLWFPVYFFVLLYQREKSRSDYRREGILVRVSIFIYTLAATSIVTFMLMLIAYFINN